MASPDTFTFGSNDYRLDAPDSMLELLKSVLATDPDFLFSDLFSHLDSPEKFTRFIAALLSCNPGFLFANLPDIIIPFLSAGWEASQVVNTIKEQILDLIDHDADGTETLAMFQATDMFEVWNFLTLLEFWSTHDLYRNLQRGETRESLDAGAKQRLVPKLEHVRYTYDISKKFNSKHSSTAGIFSILAPYGFVPDLDFMEYLPITVAALYAPPTAYLTAEAETDDSSEQIDEQKIAQIFNKQWGALVTDGATSASAGAAPVESEEEDRAGLQKTAREKCAALVVTAQMHPEPTPEDNFVPIHSLAEIKTKLHDKLTEAHTSDDQEKAATEPNWNQACITFDGERSQTKSSLGLNFLVKSFLDTLFGWIGDWFNFKTEPFSEITLQPKTTGAEAGAEPANPVDAEDGAEPIATDERHGKIFLSRALVAGDSPLESAPSVRSIREKCELSDERRVVVISMLSPPEVSGKTVLGHKMLAHKDDLTPEDNASFYNIPTHDHSFKSWITGERHRFQDLIPYLEIAYNAIRNGDYVVVNCMAAHSRSLTFVATCRIIYLGESAEEAVSNIHKDRPEAKSSLAELRAEQREFLIDVENNRDSYLRQIDTYRAERVAERAEQIVTAADPAERHRLRRIDSCPTIIPCPA